MPNGCATSRSRPNSPAANTNSSQPQEPFPLGPEFSQQIADLEPAPQVEASPEPEASDQDSPTDADSDDASGDPVIDAQAPWTNPEVTLHEAATALSGEQNEDIEEEVSMDPVDVETNETGQNPTDDAAPEAEAPVDETAATPAAWHGAVPAAVLLGIPLYSNASGVIPVAESLLNKGLPVGTTLAFMMSTVAASFPEFMMLKQVMKPKLLLIFFLLLLTMFTTVGWIFNLIHF